jgi:hypothetical protein
VLKTTGSLLGRFRLALVVAGLGLTLLAVSCGGDDKKSSYPPEVRDNFMDSCTSSGGNERQCKCAWDEITKTIKFEDFVKMEQDIAAGNGGEELVPIITKCLSG